MSLLAILGLPLEIEYRWTYYAAVLAAMLLVPCLTVLLTAIESATRSPAADKDKTPPDVPPPAPPAPPAGTPAPTDAAAVPEQKPVAAARNRDTTTRSWFTILFFVSSSVVAFLFLSDFTNWNKIVLSSSSVFLALALGLVTAGGYGFLLRLHPWPTFKRVSVTGLKEAFAITGIVFALYSGKTAVVAMTRGANSNAAVVSGQLAQSEARIDQEEANDPTITTIYFAPAWEDLLDWKKSAAQRKPGPNPSSRSAEAEAKMADTAVREFADRIDQYARNYWRARLATSVAAAVKPLNPPVTALDVYAFVEGEDCASAEALTGFIFGADGRTLIGEAGHYRAIRGGFTKLQVHAILIFNQLHMINDYIEDKVIRRSDLDAWIGYVDDMGPHPLALTTLYNWLDKKYCMQEFYREIRLRCSGRLLLIRFLTEIGNEKPEVRANCRALISRLNDPQEPEMRAGFYRDTASLFRIHLTEEDRNRAYDKLVWLRVWETYMVAAPHYHDLVKGLPTHEGRNR